MLALLWWSKKSDRASSRYGIEMESEEEAITSVEEMISDEESASLDKELSAGAVPPLEEEITLDEEGEKAEQESKVRANKAKGGRSFFIPPLLYQRTRAREWGKSP